MKNAKELLLEFTVFSFKDPEKGAAMFPKDGAFEMPYLTTFGFLGRYQGREEIALLPIRAGTLSGLSV